MHTARDRRLRLCLFVCLGSGCGDDPDPLPAESGTETTDTTVGTSAGPTSADPTSTSSASSTSEGETDSEGGTSGGPSEPIDPSLLEWEVLPAINGDADRSAGQTSVAVDEAGEVYVAAISAIAPGWSPPWSIHVYQLVDGAWVALGDGPIDSSDQSIYGGSLAAAAGEVFVIYRINGEAVFSSFTGGAWTPVAVDPSAAELEIEEVVIDDDGRPMVLGAAGTSVRVYRRDGTWSQLGGDLSAAGVPMAGGSLVAARDRVVAVADGAVHLFDGGAWSELGAYAEPDAVLAIGGQVALDLDGVPIVAWREDTDDGTRLYAARWNEDTSAFERLPGDISFDGPGASYVRIVVDPFGTLFATWRESNVYVATFDGDAWSRYVGDGAVSADGGTLPDFALTREGLPVVVYEAYSEETAGFIGVTRAVLE